MINAESITRPRLTVVHLALVRGWVQGLALSDLAERYFAGLGDNDGCIDLRVAKSILIRVLDELGAVARRLKIKDSITLKRQASRIRVAPNAPTLEDFAETLESPDFYSESELVELYTHRYSKSVNEGARSEARKARLVHRQLNLIAELALNLSAPMSLVDDVDAWFDDITSQRLKSAQLKTIEDVCSAIVNNPDNWFDSVDSIGSSKANRICNFILAHRGNFDDVRSKSSQCKPCAVIQSGFRQLLSTQLEDAPKDSTVLELSMPDAGSRDVVITKDLTAHPLSGYNGSLRGTGVSSIDAKNDFEALQIWLSLKASPKTITLYRREVERLMMWCTRIQHKPLSSLSIKDAILYREFLSNVPETWISKKGTLQTDPQWTPFAGSLSESSIKKSLVVVQAFFSWLVQSNYCIASPFYGVKVESQTLDDIQQVTQSSDVSTLDIYQQKQGNVITRTLPITALKAIEDELKNQEKSEKSDRDNFVFHFAYQTGMRISELASARIGHLKKIEPTATDSGGWTLSVIGKRGKYRDVPISDNLIERLSNYLAQRSLPSEIEQTDAGTFLIGRLPSKIAQSSDAGNGIKVQAVHTILTNLFQRASERLGINDQSAAKRLRDASAHWLRHTCATQATAAQVPLDVVASSLGHASLSTTSRYIHTEDRRKIKEMNRLWNQ